MSTQDRCVDVRLPVIRARIPRPLQVALERACMDTGQTRSALLRDLLTRGLESRGYWPPRPDARRE